LRSDGCRITKEPVTDQSIDSGRTDFREETEMNTLNSMMALGLAALVVGGPAFGKGSDENPAQVEVLNFPDKQNVTVAGTANVNVSALPNVIVSSLPDVNVSTMPEVTINDKTPVRVAVTNAASNAVEPFGAQVLCEDAPTSPDSRAVCYFDVPPGKMLSIERMSGYTRRGNVEYLGVSALDNPGSQVSYRIPQNSHTDNDVVIFEATGDIYIKDFDFERDFVVVIDTDLTLWHRGETVCEITGKLFDTAP
jgi:hypothetical protein